MFSAYFATSYFPSGWSGSREAAAPGQMRLFAAGTSTMLVSVRGWATSGTVQAGSGSVLAPALGRGLVAVALSGAGALSSTIQGDAGGPTFGNMACATGGSGALGATFYREQTEQPGGGLGFRRPWRQSEPEPPTFGDMAVRLAGRSGLLARVIGDRRVEQLAPEQPEQYQAPIVQAAPVVVQVAQQEQPAAIFADAAVRMGGGSSTRASAVAYGDCAAELGGSGALQAAGDLAYDDTEEIALALLMLRRAA